VKLSLKARRGVVELARSAAVSETETFSWHQQETSLHYPLLMVVGILCILYGTYKSTELLGIFERNRPYSRMALYLGLRLQHSATSPTDRYPSRNYPSCCKRA
jgi:hypothetical protein